MNNKINILFCNLKSIINIFDNNFNKFFIIDNNINNIYLNNLLLTKSNYSLCFNENNKNFFYIFKIISKLINLNFNKDLVICGIGGGVVTDITGLISAIYYRGIKYISIPSTLLSQVDASIGGKTAVNFFNIKNIIGIIIQHYYVIVYSFLLYSLPLKYIIFGFAESIKVSIINNYYLFNIYYNQINIILFKVIEYVLFNSIKSKLLISLKDINDKFYRLKLNLGHSFAHIIEGITDFTVTHGLSVFIGLYISLLISRFFIGLSLRNFITIIKLLVFYVPNILILVKFYINKINFIKIIDKKISFNFIKLVLVKCLFNVIIKRIIINLVNKIILIFSSGLVNMV